jgi:hypothetical protein
MIQYSQTHRGDILRVVGAGAPGYAKNGELVRAINVRENGVVVENVHGTEADFCFNCGAARLEPTEWRNDFPVDSSGRAGGDVLASTGSGG